MSYVPPPIDACAQVMELCMVYVMATLIMNPLC